ncbi:IS6 family transposase [Streptomyces sp. NPDC057580]|uniref:IS6 family transposase n=1 Tax=Streptomyces sp. NPDC057580 TaxID=3346173 RepID=UPI0036C5CEDD
MLERGVVVSRETIRRWCLSSGRLTPTRCVVGVSLPGGKWHLGEVFVKVNGERKYLWRAVDADGKVLDILVQNRRDKAAAKRFIRKLMKATQSVPRVIVTDKLRSYGAAHREAMPSVEHRSHKGLNNRAENSHQPTRQRERAMKGFRSVGGAQSSCPRSAASHPHFRPRRHLMTATEYRTGMSTRFTISDQITGPAALPTAA